jgi:hypothetical protein
MDREAKDGSGPEVLEGVLQVIEAGADQDRGQRLRAFAHAALGRAPADFLDSCPDTVTRVAPR